MGTEARRIDETDTHKRHRPRVPKRWTKRLRKRYKMKMRKWGSRRNLTPLGLQNRELLFRALATEVMGIYTSCIIFESDRIEDSVH